MAYVSAQLGLCILVLYFGDTSVWTLYIHTKPTYIFVYTYYVYTKIALIKLESPHGRSHRPRQHKEQLDIQFQIHVCFLANVTYCDRELQPMMLTFRLDQNESSCQIFTWSYAEIPTAVVESEIPVAGFPQMAPLCVSKFIDVDRKKCSEQNSV